MPDKRQHSEPFILAVDGQTFISHGGDCQDRNVQRFSLRFNVVSWLIQRFRTQLRVFG
ncbi:hypothetical protein N182_27810 [Sinorhizobium sp. GL2]|nr:hypothetical protein N182_27810 [Sinorhizobium sp. GL2]